ncbi:MAG: hypothetical protein JWQ94_1498 [Tardiphaga sp.]|nr:hypothetical protein [Tardiphaga sp.]
MPDEAFALSPISARPSVPGEADYEAIREAFMETARGRWFLNEYAKRNRHTDTGMVLEAVARIEASLKAQKQAPATISLSDALGAIRAAVRQAKATAIETLPRIDADDTLTAARNGARIVREIAWTLRECGADTRICDLLDTHGKAIDAGLQGAGDEGRETVLASYDLLMQRIEQLADGSTASSAAPTEKSETPAEKPMPAEARASVTPLFKAPEPVVEQVVTPEPVVEQAIAPAVAETAVPIAESTIEIAATIAEVSLPDVAEQVAMDEPETAARDAEAYDLAVLDRVAMEMAVQDFSEPETAEPEIAEPEMEPPQLAQLQIAAPEVEQPAAAPEVVATAPLAEVAAAMPAPAVAAVAPEPEPQPEPAYHPSLGAALIANGVISNPNAPASDPLAPIRRMSQAEKIAFFS